MLPGKESYASHCQPNKEGLSVCQKFYKCKECKKIVSDRVRILDRHHCGEVMCWDCDELVYPKGHRCYMKPVESDEEKQEKQNKNRQKRQQLTEQMVNEKVEEEEVNEGDNDDYQEYFSFNIESQQDDDRHIANLLIVQENMSYLTQVRTSASHRENCRPLQCFLEN